MWRQRRKHQPANGSKRWRNSIAYGSAYGVIAKISQKAPAASWQNLKRHQAYAKMAHQYEEHGSQQQAAAKGSNNQRKQHHHQVAYRIKEGSGKKKKKQSGNRNKLAMACKSGGSIMAAISVAYRGSIGSLAWRNRRKRGVKSKRRGSVAFLHGESSESNVAIIQRQRGVRHLGGRHQRRNQQ